MATTEQDLYEFIRAKVREVCALDCFTEWLSKEAPDPGDLILINNSFLYRDKTETTKNPQYLALLATDEGIDKAELVVATSSGINANFRRFRKNRDLPSTTSLEQACHQALSTMRRLVFILIGELDFSQEFRHTIQHSLFDCLVLCPDLGVNLTIDGRNILVKEVDEEELLWNELNIEAKNQGLVEQDLPQSLLQPFLNAVKELRRDCYVKLVLPRVHSSSDQTFLDLVVRAFIQNAHEYRESLEKWNSGRYEPQEYTNILRIAYNFAKEGITMLRLLFKVCDLKPILLWMTIKEHIELNEAFCNLPKARTSTKFSLSDYDHLIGGARNRAFHHLLPFEHTLLVQLDGVPIAAKHLRLFPEHSYSRSKGRSALEYEDRELVEILTEFTRAEQRSVSPTFWQRNLDVMASTINLLAATSNALKILNEIE
jgi:hypothetical protein